MYFIVFSWTYLYSSPPTPPHPAFRCNDAAIWTRSLHPEPQLRIVGQSTPACTRRVSLLVPYVMIHSIRCLLLLGNLLCRFNSMGHSNQVEKSSSVRQGRRSWVAYVSLLSRVKISSSIVVIMSSPPAIVNVVVILCIIIITIIGSSNIGTIFTFNNIIIYIFTISAIRMIMILLIVNNSVLTKSASSFASSLSTSSSSQSRKKK